MAKMTLASTSQQRKTGIVKWFNVLQGYGFITSLDGSGDVFVHQTVIRMSGFRSLEENEIVEYVSRQSEKGLEATFVCGPHGASPRGSHRRPRARRKLMKTLQELQVPAHQILHLIRCYNCGDYGSHLSAQCPHGPMPKCCYFCHGQDHLVGNCPNRLFGRSIRKWPCCESSIVRRPVPAVTHPLYLNRESPPSAYQFHQQTFQRPPTNRVVQ